MPKAKFSRCVLQRECTAVDLKFMLWFTNCICKHKCWNSTDFTCPYKYESSGFLYFFFLFNLIRLRAHTCTQIRMASVELKLLFNLIRLRTHTRAHRYARLQWNTCPLRHSTDHAHTRTRLLRVQEDIIVQSKTPNLPSPLRQPRPLARGKHSCSPRHRHVSQVTWLLFALNMLICYTRLLRPQAPDLSPDCSAYLPEGFTFCPTLWLTVKGGLCGGIW